MQNQDINIKLTKEEAIVLFEFLVRINKNHSSEFIEDQSEQRVLWNIESILEKDLDDTFSDDYQEIIKLAREKVRDKLE